MRFNVQSIEEKNVCFLMLAKNEYFRRIISRSYRTAAVSKCKAPKKFKIL